MSWFESHVHCPLCRYDIREGISDTSADQVNLGQDLSDIAEDNSPLGADGADGADGEEETEEEQPVHSDASTVNNSIPGSSSSSSTPTHRERNNIPSAQNEISNILEMLTSEVTNHINNAGIGDSIHIELESHPILITHLSPENSRTRGDNATNQQQEEQPTETEGETQREGESEESITQSTSSSHIL